MKHLYYQNDQVYAILSEEVRKYFYADGTLKTFEPYQAGRLHGEVSLYWPNARLKRVCSFDHGVRQGQDLMWDEEGRLVDEGSYAKGVPVGTHRRFCASRKIEEIEYLEEGRFNLWEWDEEGNLRIEALWDHLSYKERVWDRFKHEWVNQTGYWDGNKLIYTS